MPPEIVHKMERDQSLLNIAFIVRCRRVADDGAMLVATFGAS
jgi:hypothetical protein